MKVKYFCVPYNKLVTCDVDSTLEEVTRKLLSNNVGSVIVTRLNESKQRIVSGIITKTDLLLASIQFKDIKKTAASEIMSSNVIICNEDDEREAVAKVMVNLSVHHVLVQNLNREIIGITSSLDLAKEMVVDAQDNFPYFRKLFGVSRSQIDNITYTIEKKIEDGIESLGKVFPEQPLYSPELL